MTSNPTRTSPVKRGKWILEALLDSAPPPPPPGVGTLEQAGPADAQLSLVERLALHRADAQCAACHDTMDALGLGLENFDAIGRWRDSDGPFAIHATATLPDGRSFSDPAGLRGLLAADGAFVASLARHLAVYALGRPLDRADEYALAELRRRLPADPTLYDLVLGVIEMPAMRTLKAPAQQNQ
ncbi:MAG: DUF1588 domain-containing protein [Planctomycetota bacterium]